MLTLSSGKLQPAVLKPAILSLEECLARKLANPHMENIYPIATLSYRLLVLDPCLRSDTCSSFALTAVPVIISPTSSGIKVVSLLSLRS